MLFTQLCLWFLGRSFFFGNKNHSVATISPEKVESYDSEKKPKTNHSKENCVTIVFSQSDGFEAFSLVLSLTITRPDTHTLSLSQSHATTHSLSLSLSADVGIHGNNNQTRALRLIRPLTNCAKSLQRQAAAITTTQASGQSDTSSSALRQGEHFNCHGQDL